MSLSRSSRLVFGLVPMLAALGLMGGCDDSGGKPPEFPQVGKPAPASAAKTAPEKGSDRVGSESGTPRP